MADQDAQAGRDASASQDATGSHDAAPGQGAPAGLRGDLRRVLIVAAVVVVAVLIVVVLTNDVSRAIRTPITIAVLVVGTAGVLWEITRRPGSAQ
ncbi:MAG TPA: hypothetical protein VIM30_08750 [Candidatus Limnocylindrales bacterium]